MLWIQSGKVWLMIPTLFHTWLRFLIVYTPRQYNSHVYTSKRRIMSIIILKQIMSLKKSLNFLQTSKMSLKSPQPRMQLQATCLLQQLHKSPHKGKPCLDQCSQGFSTLGVSQLDHSEPILWPGILNIPLKTDMAVSYKWSICESKARYLVDSATLKNSHFCY